MKEIINSIAIWGDSILKGVIFSSERSRYMIIRENAVRIVSCILGLNLINNSTMGRTIAQGSEVVEGDIGKFGSGDVALIEFGGNDCDFMWREIAENPTGTHYPRTPLDKFEAHLQAIIERVRRAGLRPLLMTLPPLHAGRYFEFISRDGGRDAILSWLGGDVQMIYRWHERYSNAIARVAAGTASRIVDVRDAFLSAWNYEELLCDDGIHPNEKGHRLIADTFIKFAEAY